MTTQAVLNGICPYFTMFPLDFPYQVLRRHAAPGSWVLDPFCGRGTTNYAGRLLGLPSIGIDSSPVAAAISAAKLANTTPAEIVAEAQVVLSEVPVPCHVPSGPFWEWGFDTSVLIMLCRLREGLLLSCETDARKALRAVLLGALHGPRGKTRQTYFSNQSQRTYAPKPRYAVSFWERHGMCPPKVDVLEIIRMRSERYYGPQMTQGHGTIIYGDSRMAETYTQISAERRVGWVLTSPPYYGMRTYRPDQWLRLWFLGGDAMVDYSMQGQVEHTSPSAFAQQLRMVWEQVGMFCSLGARMIVRFGAINDRKAEPMPILRESLRNTGWKIQTRHSAGLASAGHRQAMHIAKEVKGALEEFDVWAVWEG